MQGIIVGTLDALGCHNTRESVEYYRDAGKAKKSNSLTLRYTVSFINHCSQVPPFSGGTFIII